MERNEILTKKVKKYCIKIGVNVVGFADPKHYERYPKYNNPEQFLKEAQTIIVIGFHIFDLVLDSWSINSKTGKNYQFADRIIENFCYLVKKFLLKQGYESEIISYTPGLFLKDSAAIAGIGPIGKNNLLITNQFGSQIRLRALATTASLVCGTPILESEYCNGCNICIDSCPAKAFPDGKYNKDICLTYNLSHLRKLSEYSSIWCNICIESCPIGKKE